MKMTKEQVTRVAKNILATLKKNNLMAVKAISQNIDRDPLGGQIDDAHSGEEYVQITGHPADPSAVMVRYFRRIGQEPMQIIIRPRGCKVVLTCVDELDGYEVFDEDPELGKMQDQKFSDFTAVLSELKKLVLLHK